MYRTEPILSANKKMSRTIVSLVYSVHTIYFEKRPLDFHCVLFFLVVNVVAGLGPVAQQFQIDAVLLAHFDILQQIACRLGGVEQTAAAFYVFAQQVQICVVFILRFLAQRNGSHRVFGEGEPVIEPQSEIERASENWLIEAMMAAHRRAP